MEFLVTMTTDVPEGTSEEAVQDVRTREAAHSRDLAVDGHLLRLWRPPLKPGQWRTLGLFAADDEAQLEKVLESMPLSMWRTDEVTPLALHPNDPADLTDSYSSSPSEAKGTEYLTTFAVTVPPGTASETVDATTAAEAASARVLAAQGHLLRLWKLPGQGRALGLWRVRDSTQMQEILTSLPLSPWLSVHTTPLSPHPSDPLRMRR